MLLAAPGAVAAPPGAEAELSGEAALEAGIRAYQDFDAEAAVAALERALSSPELGASERARAQLYLGLLAFEDGDVVAAKRAFGAALRLAPEVGAPPGTSPKATTLIAEVRAALPASEVAEEGPARARREVTPEEAEEGVVAAGSDKGETRVEATPLLDPSAPAAAVGASPEPREDEGPPWGWIGLGAGVAAVAAAAVAAVLVVDAQGDECGPRGGAGGCVVFTIR
jgi:tetratricopeptide (TPR) repeat protein